MTNTRQIRIPATYMRGGTSKGVFFHLADLPIDAQQPGPPRDQLMLRVMGSPDPYGKQIDGMGGASSSTSKVAIVSRSQSADHDVDYLFGQIAIDRPFVDWSGNCGNLTSAVGTFAIATGLIPSDRLAQGGCIAVRIWQANIGKTIIAHVPICEDGLLESGDFELDGVAFPSAEVELEFLEPTAEADGALFPTGHLIDELEIPDYGSIPLTLINAGIPTVIIEASSCGFTGTETQQAISADAAALLRLEAIRSQAAVKMGLIRTPAEAVTRQHTPKLVMVASPQTYVAANGVSIAACDQDLLVRALSMGKPHHAMMGTAAVAVAAAAAIPGTLASKAIGGTRHSLWLGHPSGRLKVGAEVHRRADGWHVERAQLSRSARTLMEGWVCVPATSLGGQPPR